METIENLIKNDLLINIDRSESCITFPTIDARKLAVYMVAAANSGGQHLIIGVNAHDIIGVNPKIIKQIYEEAKSLCEGFEPTLTQVSNVRSYNIAIVTVNPKEKLCSLKGEVYELIDKKPYLMAEPKILQKIGLALNSDLINSLASQISDQSITINKLRNTVDKSYSWRRQWKGWVIGALVGFFISEIFKFIFLIL